VNTRTIDNQTNLSFQVTLYIQAGDNPEQIYGTLNLILCPSESKQVSYGDLRNCFLAAIRLAPLPFEPTDSYYGRVSQRGDDTDDWLNNSETIDLSSHRLKTMESVSPFQTADSL